MNDLFTNTACQSEPSTLTWQDTQRVIDSLPGFIPRLLNDGFYIGGGCIRSVIAGEPISDVDIFGSDRDSLDKAAEDLRMRYGGTKFVTANAITVRVPGMSPIQFIRRWVFDTPEACMQSFDFTISRAVIYAEFTTRSGDPLPEPEYSSVCDDRFYEDLTNKRITYCQPKREEDPAGSFLRVQKFIKRGYKVPPMEYAKMIARLLSKTKLPFPPLLFEDLPAFEAYESDLVEAVAGSFNRSTKRHMGY